MRILAVVLGLVLLLTACGQPAGPLRTTSMRAQLADSPHKIPVTVPVNPDPRVGPIFLLGGEILHTCTGSVVHSSTGDLILTAAHCLAQGFPTTFVPGFADAAAPSNVWTVDAVYLDPRWIAARDPHADYAISRVSRAGGGSVEAQVGSALLLGTAPAPGSQVSIIGYAAGVGVTPIGCQASTGITTSGYPSFRCADLVVGTSGSPWISGSTVTGVTGGLENGGCTPDVSYSAPFDERTAALLARAEAGGPGEAAPIAFFDCQLLACWQKHGEARSIHETAIVEYLTLFFTSGPVARALHEPLAAQLSVLLQVYSFSTLISRYPQSIVEITDYSTAAVYGS